jgi:hypothetical protein
MPLALAETSKSVGLDQASGLVRRVWHPRSEPRFVLRQRPWSYEVACAVWLPEWLLVLRS